MIRYPAAEGLDRMLEQVPTGNAVVLGLMSGTSLDGLDLCLTRILYGSDLPWSFEILHASTAAYPEHWKQRLLQGPSLKAGELGQLDAELGRYWGELIAAFMREGRSINHDLPDPVLIASHGHTLCHRPDAGHTLQIGSAAYLHALTHLPVVYDFRSLDLALGGQGAPLVPAGDALLFGQYDACLNLGGIANLSWSEGTGRAACDLTFCNTALNFFALRTGLGMDLDGQLALKGRPQPELLDFWAGAPWYRLRGARSLDSSLFAAEFLKEGILEAYSPEDLCHNWCLHLASVVSDNLHRAGRADHPHRAGRADHPHRAGRADHPSILVTGGGAAHPFLIRSLQAALPHRVHVPDPTLRDFKEALIFGLLGLLHHLRLPNVLGQSTGSAWNHLSGSRIG
jgi:anhydro-N-acetylmuramic acid kinase